MIILRFPAYLVDFLLLYGLFCLAIHIARLSKAVAYRIKNKTWETNLQEQKMFLLLEKNKTLSEMTDCVIKTRSFRERQA